MGYSIKIDIQKKLNYSGSPSPSNVSSVELLTRFKTFTDPDDTPENQLAFAEAEKTIRVFKSSDYFQNNLDDEDNLGIAFADGTMELGDIGIATSNHTLPFTVSAPWGAFSSPSSTVQTRNHFKMARHSDFPVGGANLNEDPEDFKITVDGNFNWAQGVGATPTSTNNIEGLICIVYFGNNGYKNRLATFYIPAAMAPGLQPNISVDCLTDSASWTLPVGVPQEHAEQLFNGISTTLQNTSHYNVCSAYGEMQPAGGYQSTQQVVVCPVVNTDTYTDLANSGGTIELESDFTVQAPPGAPASVVDGIDTPSFFGDTCTASPLEDGFWYSSFIGEVCPTVTAQLTQLYGVQDSCLLGIDNMSGSPTGTSLNIPGFPSFPLNNIPGNILDTPQNLSIVIDYTIEFVTWYNVSVDFEIDCVLDTTLVNSITAAGSQYGDLLCEVYCCLKKLQDRYEENKLKNPKASALDKNKLNEAMVLVGLFEWAIKCNTKKEKINKYYKNILSVTGCSGCTGCS